MRMGTGQIEVELVEGGLGEELGAAGEGFQVVELVLDPAVDGLNIALVGVGGGRDALMLRPEEGDGGGGSRSASRRAATRR